MRFKLEQINFQRCYVFSVIVILYTIDLYGVLIPQNESKCYKIVSIQTMSTPKILCLPPVANTLRDLDMRFTWVLTRAAKYGLGDKKQWLSGRVLDSRRPRGRGFEPHRRHCVVPVLEQDRFILA